MEVSLKLNIQCKDLFLHGITIKAFIFRSDSVNISSKLVKIHSSCYIRSFLVTQFAVSIKKKIHLDLESEGSIPSVNSLQLLNLK